MNKKVFKALLTDFDQDPLSQKVKPILGLMSGIVGIILLAFISVMAAMSGQFTIAGAGCIIILLFAFWYFNIRTKDLSSILAILGAGINIPDEPDPPPPPPPEPDPVEPPTPPPEPEPVLPTVIQIIAMGPREQPVSTNSIEDYPNNLDDFIDVIKEEVDQMGANMLAAGQIAGIPPTVISPDQFKYKVPILSSDNPSMMFGRLLGRSEAIIIRDNQQSLDFYKQLLLPAALLALTDQQGSILASGNKCSWPPSPYAASWVQWCSNAIYAMEEIIRSDFYDFKSYSVWYAGQIAEAWVSKRVNWLTTYDKGNPVFWFYPNKPEVVALSLMSGDWSCG